MNLNANYLKTYWSCSWRLSVQLNSRCLLLKDPVTLPPRFHPVLALTPLQRCSYYHHNLHWHYPIELSPFDSNCSVYLTTKPRCSTMTRWMDSSSPTANSSDSSPLLLVILLLQQVKDSTVWQGLSATLPSPRQIATKCCCSKKRKTDMINTVSHRL